MGHDESPNPHTALPQPSQPTLLRLTLAALGAFKLAGQAWPVGRDAVSTVRWRTSSDSMLFAIVR
ncbi:hypothetical protein IAQ61_004537 [Plenodomus lingam]|uniref:uncharacterized protein n=1 Tax=Leptosphaeria maculans TaxID=5022 RepID=UPI003331AB53|nr:hypothetical protein IAQ61_004537 [Plenodomus lingam]